MNFLNTKPGIDLLTKFLEGKSEASQQVYSCEIRKFFGFYSGDITEIDEKVLSDFRKSQKTSNEKTLQRKISIVTSFLDLARRQGLIRQNLKSHGSGVRFSEGTYIETRQFKEIMSKFQKTLHSPLTVTNYKSQLLSFFTEFNRPPELLTLQYLTEYYSILREKRLSDNTINLRFHALNKFCKFYELKKPGFQNPVDLKRIGVRRASTYGKKDCFTWYELWQFLSKINRKTLIGCRDFALFLLMTEQALRCFEIAKIRMVDIIESDPRHGAVILLSERKGHSGRKETKTKQKIEKHIFYHLNVWIKKAERAGYRFTPGALLFPPVKYMPGEGYVLNRDLIDKGVPLTTSAIRHRFYLYFPKAKIQMKGRKLSVHSLRHTGAVGKVQDGWQPFDLSYFLGHSDMSITRLYFHPDVDLNPKMTREDFIRKIGLLK